MTTKNKFGIASLVLGILALISFPLIIPPLISGSLAIIFAMVSKSKEQKLLKGALTGVITASLGLLASVFVTGVSLITTFKSTDFTNLLSSYMSLLEYTSTLSDDELLDLLDDIEHGDYSDLADFYNTTTPTDEQIWY